MDYFAFLTYVLLTAYTPGPNNIMALGNAGRDGFRKTIPFLAGMFVGFLFVMALCAMFTTLLFNMIPVVEPYMVMVGVIYLIYLAWTVWRDKPKTKGKTSNQSNSFGTGAILQLVNVKVILYGITAFSSFVLPHYRKGISVAGFSLLLSLIGLSGCIAWAAMGTVIERLFQSRRRLLNTILALLLIYCAISLVLSRHWAL